MLRDRIQEARGYVRPDDGLARVDGGMARPGEGLARDKVIRPLLMRNQRMGEVPMVYPREGW